MTMSDPLIERLAALDPARGVQPDDESAEQLLRELLDASVGAARESGSLRAPSGRRFLPAIALLALLALTGVALAATGVIGLGSPAPPSDATRDPSQGIGSLLPGSARVLSLQTPDPAGGLPWGLRLVGTTRGVGCVEVGRKLGQSIGALGVDGAFGDDGKFHELPPGGLAAGGTCANLDANHRLFRTAAVLRRPDSGIIGDGSCLALAPGEEIRSPTPHCPRRALRRLFYGLLGPQAVSLTYTLDGQTHSIAPAGPEGAYLIVLPFAERRSSAEALWEHMSGDETIGSQLPMPWTTPITSVSYSNGTVCHIAALGPGRLKEHCAPVGYRPADKLPSEAEVRTPVNARLETIAGRRMLRVSLTARVPVSDASSAYELMEDTSSPLAVYTQTKKNIAVGQTVSWLLPADGPGVYSGKVVFGVNLPASYPVYGPGETVLIGRFSVRAP